MLHTSSPALGTGSWASCRKSLLSCNPVTSLTRPGARSSFRHVISAAGKNAMVWYKADLRVDDHHGLLQAAQEHADSNVLPVYVLDPHTLHHLEFLPAGPEVLVKSLEELRVALRDRGSDLVVAQGRWRDQVPELAKKHNITKVYAQQEVEYTLDTAASEVTAALQSQGIEVVWWNDNVWPQSSFKYDFKDWQRNRPAPVQPEQAPAAVPAIPSSINDTGDIPDASTLRKMLASEPPSHIQDPEILRQEVDVAFTEARDGKTATLQKEVIQHGRDWLARLTAYLAYRRFEDAAAAAGSSSGLSKVVAEGILSNESEAAEGASFPALFAVAMLLGALSRRRVYSEAVKAAGGSLGSGSVSPARAAGQTAESSDFHWQLSKLNGQRAPNMDTDVTVRAWRWNGYLTEYCYVAPPADKELPEEAPAILLLHGFGAFGDHWRNNMQQLAAAGYHVYAPTLPGKVTHHILCAVTRSFGRSEKACVPYSQILWSNFLRDFCVQVAGRPVVVAGNSIGGFIATNMASEHPSLVSGLVLLNSAGPIDEAGTFTMEQWHKDAAAKKPPPKWLVKLIAGGLFWYLERTVPGTLAWLYPTAPERVKGWLSTEIERAAGDPGAVEVFGAVFYLPPPRPLDWLIKNKYKKPTLVLQGVLDPLNDATSRARSLGKLLGSQAEIQEIKAGHCPHDEVPATINTALLDWINRKVLQAVQPAAAQKVPV